MPHAPTRSPHTADPYADDPDTDATFRRIAALPDGPERTALRHEAVCAWAPLADRLARRFRHRGESFEDLKQVAQLGLIKAVTRFDPGLGTAFPPYAIPTIRGEVKRHFRDNLWAVHVPRRVQELRHQVRSAGNERASLHGRVASVHELVTHTGLTQEEVRLGAGALESFTSLSLDAVLGQTGYSPPLTETLGDTEPGFDLIVDREALRPLLRELPERERQILYLRFFCEMTQSAIAGQLGISQMHVSRLITLTCARLRAQVMAEAQDHSWAA
jgi:RNA polymerase sigma-B factor